MGRSYCITAAMFGCMLTCRCAESHWCGEKLLRTTWAFKPEMVEEEKRIAFLHEVRVMEGKSSHDNERGMGIRRRRKERRCSAWTMRIPLSAMRGLRGGGGDEFDNMDTEVMHQTAVEEEVREVIEYYSRNSSASCDMNGGGGEVKNVVLLNNYN